MNPFTLHRAMVKRRDTDEAPEPVLFSGLVYCAPYPQILQYVQQMQQAFPMLEYTLEQVEDEDA